MTFVDVMCCSADFASNYAALKSLGWDVVWLNHGPAATEEIYLAPLTQPPAKPIIKFSTSTLTYIEVICSVHVVKLHVSLVLLMQNLQFFCSKDALASHMINNPCLLDSFQMLWCRLSGCGWEKVVVIDSDAEQSRSFCYQIKDMGGVERQWGLHKFKSMEAVQVYIHR